MLKIRNCRECPGKIPDFHGGYVCNVTGRKIQNLDILTCKVKTAKREYITRFKNSTLAPILSKPNPGASFIKEELRKKNISYQKLAASFGVSKYSIFKAVKMNSAYAEVNFNTWFLQMKISEVLDLAYDKLFPNVIKNDHEKKVLSAGVVMPVFNDIKRVGAKKYNESMKEFAEKLSKINDF